MSSIQKLSDPQTKAVIGLIMSWLSDQLTTDAFMWLSRKMMRLKIEPDDKQFNMIFKVIPKKLGSRKLIIGEEDRNTADSYRKNWEPINWQIDEAARIAVILNVADELPSFISCIEKIIHTSKDNELIALYKGLPLFPHSQQYLSFAMNTLKETRKSVFEALAHNNPYPFENFDETMWDEMIAHAQSMKIKLEPIIGLNTETMCRKGDAE